MLNEKKRQSLFFLHSAKHIYELGIEETEPTSYPL